MDYYRFNRQEILQKAKQNYFKELLYQELVQYKKRIIKK